MTPRRIQRQLRTMAAMEYGTGRMYAGYVERACYMLDTLALRITPEDLLHQWTAAMAVRDESVDALSNLLPSSSEVM